jgi:hypothetical protein
MLEVAVHVAANHVAHSVNMVLGKKRGELCEVAPVVHQGLRSQTTLD